MEWGRVQKKGEWFRDARVGGRGNEGRVGERSGGRGVRLEG